MMLPSPLLSSSLTTKASRPVLAHAATNSTSYKSYMTNRKNILSKRSLSELATVLELASIHHEADSRFIKVVQLDLISMLGTKGDTLHSYGQLSRILRSVFSQHNSCDWTF